jgi:hypothetical protein
MTERMRHKNYLWSLPDFGQQGDNVDQNFHPHGEYPVEWAKISILQDIRDTLFEILDELRREEQKPKSRLDTMIQWTRWPRQKKS